MIQRLSVSVVFLSTLAACDSFEPKLNNDITACESGDIAVASSQMCLMDDAACYQLSDGSWCTGPRAGSGG